MIVASVVVQCTPATARRSWDTDGLRNRHGAEGLEMCCWMPLVQPIYLASKMSESASLFVFF